jgi:hypothetical protein
MLHDRAQTAMAREIQEIPLTTQRLLAEHELVATVADRIRHANPRVVVLSGRGSSGNAGTFLRYLFEARAGLLVSTSAPSVVTTYKQSINMAQENTHVHKMGNSKPESNLGLRIRGSGVRISPSAPTRRPAIKGFLAVSAFVLSAVSCCKALQLSSSELNELPGATIHSMQHGRNIALRALFLCPRLWGLAQWPGERKSQKTIRPSLR